MAKTLKPVKWEAEEYIVKDHNAWWYVGLAAVSLALIALAVWLKEWTFIALIVLSAVAVVILSLRSPRKIEYLLDNTGLTEGGRLHKFEDYKAFGILQEGEHYSAVLIPKKRFGILTKVYFPSGSGEEIVDLLGAHLPMEPVKVDFLDKIVNFLRI